MKLLKQSFTLTFFNFLIFLFLQSQVSAQSCCQLMTMEDYQILGGSSAFRNAHAEPLPFHFISLEGGTAVTFDAPDGKKGNGFFIKPDKAGSIEEEIANGVLPPADAEESLATFKL